MRSNVKIFVLAAALTAAAVSGTVWAAPNFESGSVQAEAVFDNPFTGTISWAAGPNVDGMVIGKKNVLEAANSPEKTGNVGVLAINTNGKRWDVKMTSKFGGRLYTEGKDTTIKVPATCDDFTTACRDSTIKGAGSPLKYVDSYSTSAPSGDAANSWYDGGVVVLDVAIGAAQKVVSGSFFSIGCTGASACSQAPSPVRVGKSKVLASGTVARVPTTAGGPVAPISFAEVISDSIDIIISDLTDNQQAKDFLGYDLTATGKKPDADEIKKGFKGKNNVNQYIYVNVGISPTNSGYINANGKDVYKETFTFTLYNGF